jgi:hypothetical protein
MGQRLRISAGLAIGFVLVLVYVTIESTPFPRGEARAAHIVATRECQRAVRESVADARFPFGANVKKLHDGRLQLSGSMDSGNGMEAERRNYECLMSPHLGSDGYVADSVAIWKSH